MRYAKGSVDYEVNMWEFLEIQKMIPMTVPERKAFRSWVKSGHDVDSNPWDRLDYDGEPMNFLLAYREEYGYPPTVWVSPQIL